MKELNGNKLYASVMCYSALVVLLLLLEEGDEDRDLLHFALHNTTTYRGIN
jgi:hypothetical protein